jgi:hypothetical protein
VCILWNNSSLLSASQDGLIQMQMVFVKFNLEKPALHALKTVGSVMERYVLRIQIAKTIIVTASLCVIPAPVAAIIGLYSPGEISLVVEKFTLKESGIEKGEDG